MSSYHHSNSPDFSQSSDLVDETNQVIATNINLEETFRLVDHLFSHQTCFYHQILPLAMNSQNLILAMVEPNDTSALAFINNSLKTLDYVPALNITRIDKDTIKAILSVYYHRNSSNSNTSTDKSTLILDRPKDIAASEKKTSLSKNSSLPPTPAYSSALKHLRSLDINPQYLFESPEFLASLPPKQLLVEMLGQVLTKGGIGRLYWERNPNHGRILCSQNGTTQVIIEDISLETFQETVNELKKLAYLSTDPIQKIKKSEIARLYKNKPLLLRLRFMAGKYGDEATLQILRGEALGFYQKQKLNQLYQETLDLAQQLDRKITQISIRNQFNATPIASLPELQKLMKELTQKLNALENKKG